MNNFLSLKLYKNNDLYLEKKSLNYAKTNNKYEFSLEEAIVELKEFDDNTLFPYLKKLIETIEKILAPSPMIF